MQDPQQRLSKVDRNSTFAINKDCRWAKRIGRLSRWSSALLILLLVVTANRPIGIRKYGYQIGFCDGTFIYQSQRGFGKPPHSVWSFYWSNDYGTHYSPGDFYGFHFSRTGRWTELEFPLWMPLVILLPSAMLARRRSDPAPTGPFRVTFTRFAAGVVEYILFVALGAVFLTVSTQLMPFRLLRHDFVLIFLVLASAAFPYGGYLAAKAHVARANRRFPPGFCRTCRYDLTGNESGVCPECGTPVPNAEKPKRQNAQTKSRSDGTS